MGKESPKVAAPTPPVEEKVKVHEHANHHQGHSRRPSLEVEHMKVVVVEAPKKKATTTFKPAVTTTKKRRNSLNNPVNVVKSEHDGKAGVVVTMHKIEEKFWFCVPCK